MLEKRVTDPSRAGVAKFGDPVQLRSMLARSDLHTPINAGDLSIDNSDLTPEEVAAMIAAHAGL